MNLSALEIAEGKSEEAVAWAREAFRFGAGLSRSHTALGEAFERQGRFAEAAQAYHRASGIDPNDAHARRAFERTAAARERLGR